MADLALNGGALSGFADTLRGLTKDFSQAVYPSNEFPDHLHDNLGDLAYYDRRCGEGLQNYLNALASLAASAATAADALDQQLAKQASVTERAGTGMAG